MSHIAFSLAQITLFACLLYSGIMFLISWLIVCSGRRPLPQEAIPGPDEMSRHIFWGLYYCNPDDPRGWVPKSGDPARSNGYTINLRYRSWATAYNIVFIGGIIIITLIGIAAPLLH